MKNEVIDITNSTMELTDCRDKWFYDERHDCWCLEDIVYSPKADVPKFQRLSVYAPAAYVNENGIVNPNGAMNGYTAATAPIVFHTSSAGYMQMPHTWLYGPRCRADEFLKRGMVYVTCGNRGRESRNDKGQAVGKAPINLIDLKIAIRFLRHNRSALPGSTDRIVTMGTSAGGAMSSLLGVTGDHPDYDAYLREAGAFIDESDTVFASQIYCPIIDLEHADLAYEWLFAADDTCEDSHAGPAETMTPFKAALSKKLAARYIDYFNGLGLKDPDSGEALMIGVDGRSGSFYEYLMARLDDSATVYMKKLAAGELPTACGVEDYIRGNYTYEAPAPQPHGDPDAHHIGPGAALERAEGAEELTMGDIVARPPKGVPFHEMRVPMIEKRGADKRAWLSWDGARARISDLDTYILNYRRRMKPCTSFDKLDCDSGENHVFGNDDANYLHFNPVIGKAIRDLAVDFPDEAARYADAYAQADDPSLARRVALINPLNYIDPDKQGKAEHFRVRVGAFDADTAFSVAMTLALKLQNCGYDADYALVWDQPHCDADYPGGAPDWIEQITKG